MSVSLFLSHADTHEDSLPEGLPAEAVGLAGGEAARPHQAVAFDDDTADPLNLEEQRWGVIAPVGDEGERLLGAVAPLLRARQRDQGGAPVLVYRVRPAMSASDTVDWVHLVLYSEDTRPEDIPRYLLLLGRPDQVSLDLQVVLSSFRHVGRLDFDREADFEAYCEKILRWESAPQTPYKPNALLYTARDGTAATAAAWDMVMDPVAKALAAKQQGPKALYAQLDVVGELYDGDPGLLMTPAARAHPSVVFTMSHGLGAPRAGWKSEADRRAVQGALKTGRGSHLEAQDFAKGRFAPGGLWFFFACFGLGTPAASDYTPWLRKLQNVGAIQGRLDGVVAGLPAPGEPPFFAAIPKAALANPDGPLGVIGHVDLAWSYSFQDLALSTQARYTSFERFLYNLRMGRAGLALTAFLLPSKLDKEEAAIGQHEAARAEELGIPVKVDQLRQGHRWMRMKDLQGYLLLGDPAARLPPGPVRAGETPVFEGPAELRTQSEAPGTLAPGTQTPAEGSGTSFAATEAKPALAADAADPVGPTPPAPGSDPNTQHSQADQERAVLALLRGRPLAELERELGVSPQELARWLGLYTAAGAAALREGR